MYTSQTLLTSFRPDTFEYVFEDFFINRMISQYCHKRLILMMTVQILVLCRSIVSSETTPILSHTQTQKKRNQNKEIKRQTHTRQWMLFQKEERINNNNNNEKKKVPKLEIQSTADMYLKSSKEICFSSTIDKYTIISPC